MKLFGSFMWALLAPVEINHSTYCLTLRTFGYHTLCAKYRPFIIHSGTSNGIAGICSHYMCIGERDHKE